jgi:alpha-ketoglutarate-dependent 2,4-dichlorophenoxyacetate dioxygenase
MKRQTKSLGVLGAEIEGLDLREPVDDSTWAWLRKTIMREGVVLFREQPMDSERQAELGRRFGELENTSTDARPLEESDFLLSNVDASGAMRADDDEMMQLVAINEGWHTDSSFRDVPASFSLFSALTVPTEGGDTFFASLHLGWEALAPEQQAPLYGLRARHDYDQAYASRDVDMSAVFGGPGPSAVHPLARRHPETGRTGLYLTEHMFAIEGMEEGASTRLIRDLLEACVDPARTYRHQWAEGDLLIWDNRSMLHKAQGFDSQFPRVMRHVRVSGGEAAIPATV